jgi:hypothetical protein
MLDEAAEHLNRAQPVHVGNRRDWSNPESGNSGHLTVTSTFNFGGQPCHSLRYDLLFKAPRPKEIYAIDWCRTATGEWKIKSAE